MIDVAATATSISALLSRVGELAKKVRDRELNKDVIDLQELVQRLQRELVEVTAENQRLRDKVDELEHKALSQPAACRSEADLVYEESVYWVNRNGFREGPFCPICWDDKKKRMHLKQGATKGTWRCGLCQNPFTTSEYDPRPVRRGPYRGV